MLRIRVAEGQENNWLQIREVKENMARVSSLLTEIQDSSATGGWFLFCIAFSGICNAMILAWEQFEDNNC